MSEKNNGRASRRPDCVTEIRKGNTLLVVDEDMRQQLIKKLLEAIPQFPIEKA